MKLSLTFKSAMTACVLTAMGVAEADGCTNFIAGRKATTDGSVMTTYADDSYTRFGDLHHSPRAKHPAGAMRKIINWGSDKPMGEIPQARETYNVVGNMNEHQVVIGETTWGGKPELADTTGNSMIDYGSLIYIALERSCSAREAIDVMTDLVEKYGYASTGETFTIADKNEAWIMEMIGKGAEKGAVWVAVRIPEDAISGHANEPRIRKVDYKDKKNVRYSKDLMDFARKRGYFDGKDEDFSFADTFDEHDADSRRTCDARVWSFFREYVSPEEAEKMFEWVSGKSDEPMPLYIIPSKKVSLRDMQKAMRNHFEGTAYDMTNDPGAGPFNAPVRFRPLSFESNGTKYRHERPVATQQTAWSFVSQSRKDMPDAVGGVLWFGTDDANTTVYMPFYCSMTEVPLEVRPGNGDLLTFSPTANFWMNNWVANQAYNRYDVMIDDIRKVQNELEDKYHSGRAAQEQKLIEMSKKTNKAAFEAEVNAEGAAIAKEATDRYRELAQFLLVRNVDGVKKKMNEDGTLKRNPHGRSVTPDSPGYSQEFYDNIVKATGDHFLSK
ncbi:MAG: C69 family dipeptidase [Duncaniella sp.]|nr:C69 family dipeptidase [Duncaniella sp.]